MSSTETKSTWFVVKRSWGQGSLTYVERELASCLGSFSLDIVGCIGQYANELRLVHTMPLDENLKTRLRINRVVGAHVLVNSKQQLVVISDNICIYDILSGKLLHLCDFSENLTFVDVTIDHATDVMYALVCKNKRHEARGQRNSTRFLYKITTSIATDGSCNDNTVSVKKMANITNDCPNTDCIRHHNGHLYIAHATMFHIYKIAGTDIVYSGQTLQPSYGHGLGSLHVNLAIDPIDSSIYFWEHCTSAVRVFRPNAKASEIWIERDVFSFSDMVVLSSQHLVGLEQRIFANISVMLLQRDNWLVMDMFKPSPDMNILLIKDVADRVYFFDGISMYVMVV